MVGRSRQSCTPMLPALCRCAIFVSPHKFCLLIITGFLQREILEHFQPLLLKHFLLLIMLSFQKMINALFLQMLLLLGLTFCSEHIQFMAIFMLHSSLWCVNYRSKIGGSCTPMLWAVFNFHILILVAQDVAPAKTILGSTEEAFGAFSTAAGWVQFITW